MNPNDFELRVGLRSEGGGGLDLAVPPDDRVEAWVPDGRYATYFRYSSDATGIYRGQSFTLSGHGAEIQVVPASNAVPAMERLN